MTMFENMLNSLEVELKFIRLINSQRKDFIK